jgi:type VI protein secretion system component VasK
MAGTYLLVTLFEFPLFAAANATAANPRLDPLLALGASLTLFGVLAVALLVVLGSRRQPAGA